MSTNNNLAFNNLNQSDLWKTGWVKQEVCTANQRLLFTRKSANENIKIDKSANRNIKINKSANREPGLFTIHSKHLFQAFQTRF